eukprot:88236-Amorphochlora_amoeboformis.AAC.1
MSLTASSRQISQREILNGVLAPRNLLPSGGDDPGVQQSEVMGKDLQAAHFSSLLILAWRAVHAEWTSCA